MGLSIPLTTGIAKFLHADGFAVPVDTSILGRDRGARFLACGVELLPGLSNPSGIAGKRSPEQMSRTLPAVLS